MLVATVDLLILLLDVEEENCRFDGWEFDNFIFINEAGVAGSMWGDCEGEFGVDIWPLLSIMVAEWIKAFRIC